MHTARSFGAHTAETTFYTPLSNLLNSVGETLKPRVVFVAHPGNRGAGLPDGGLFPVANRRQAAPLPQRPLHPFLAHRGAPRRGRRRS